MYARVKENQKCPLKDSKALSKQEMSNVCKDACYLNPFFLNLNQLPAAKKEFKKQSSQQLFDYSYFVRALESALRTVSVRSSSIIISRNIGERYE